MSQHQQKCASLYYKSEDLKKTIQGQSKNILKDSNAWLKLNEFIEINKKLVLIDLDYVLEKKSEVKITVIPYNVTNLVIFLCLDFKRTVKSL